MTNSELQVNVEVDFYVSVSFFTQRRNPSMGADNLSVRVKPRDTLTCSHLFDTTGTRRHENLTRIGKININESFNVVLPPKSRRSDCIDKDDRDDFLLLLK